MNHTELSENLIKAAVIVAEAYGDVLPDISVEEFVAALEEHASGRILLSGNKSTICYSTDFKEDLDTRWWLWEDNGQICARIRIYRSYLDLIQPVIEFTPNGTVEVRDTACMRHLWAMGSALDTAAKAGVYGAATALQQAQHHRTTCLARDKIELQAQLDAVRSEIASLEQKIEEIRREGRDLGLELT
jgi:hypothetical protein